MDLSHAGSFPAARVDLVVAHLNQGHAFEEGGPDLIVLD
jgi:hypothetical protein